MKKANRILGVALVALCVVGFSVTSVAGGAYTCTATNSTGTNTIYIQFDFAKIIEVPGYPHSIFQLSTPIHTAPGFSHAAIYYWTVQDDPTSFKVMSVLETTDILNDKFDGRISITDGRGKPNAQVFTLVCRK